MTLTLHEIARVFTANLAGPAHGGHWLITCHPSVLAMIYRAAAAAGIGPASLDPAYGFAEIIVMGAMPPGAWEIRDATDRTGQLLDCGIFQDTGPAEPGTNEG